MIAQVLSELTSLFNEHDILYGVGGSFMIDKLHFDLMVNDLDIFVSLNNVDKIEKIMAKYQKLETKINPTIRSGYFATYMIKGVSVDIIADMHVNYKDIWYNYDLTCTDQVHDHNGINYMFLQDWFYLYWIMRRHEKVKMISDYWQNTNYPDNARWHYLLNLSLPSDLKIMINNLIKYHLSK